MTARRLALANRLRLVAYFALGVLVGVHVLVAVTTGVWWVLLMLVPVFAMVAYAERQHRRFVAAEDARQARLREIGWRR